MKKEEMNYEKWLEQLKKTPPVLENPDALTEDIMRAVKAAPFRNRPVRRLNFAAGVLLLLQPCFSVYGWQRQLLSIRFYPQR